MANNEKNKSDDNKLVYTLEITEGQAKALSHACDEFSRLICGQDWSYRRLFELAWEKRCKEATGNLMDDEFDGGWKSMRHYCDLLVKSLKSRFWGLEGCSMNGVGYDDEADILFDLHQVIRHQLWKDREESDKSRVTVDAFDATKFGSEPLARMSRKPVDNNVDNKE